MSIFLAFLAGMLVEITLERVFDWLRLRREEREWVGRQRNLGNFRSTKVEHRR